MKTVLKIIFSLLFLTLPAFSFSQTANPPIVLDSAKVAQFGKYVEYKHSMEPGGYANWVLNNKDLYLKEMWYYTESFYVKRNHFSSGEVMRESGIDISRFEQRRDMNNEVIIEFRGIKDVLVLIPGKELIYKPQ